MAFHPFRVQLDGNDWMPGLHPGLIANHPVGVFLFLKGRHTDPLALL